MNMTNKATTKYGNPCSVFIYILIFFVFLIFIAKSALAANPGSSEWVETEHTAVRIISATKTVGDTNPILLGLHFKLKAGWKIYWRSPGDAGFPPEPDWNRSENIKETSLLWPAPERFSILGLETLGYKTEVVLPIMVKRTDTTKPLQLGGNVSYLACEKICIPYDANITLKLDSGNESPSQFTHLINQFVVKVPGDGKRHRVSIDKAETWNDKGNTWLRIKASSILPFKAPDIFPEGPSIATFSRPSITLNPKGTNAILDMRVFGLDELNDQTEKNLNGRELTLTLVDGERSAENKLVVRLAKSNLTTQNSKNKSTILMILGLSILGGFILNLMPCVLPVLSIKLFSILSHSGEKVKRVRLSFLSSAAGIIFAFIAIGTTIIALKASGMTVGWGIQFQQPWFLIFMTILMMAFAFNLWGLFEIRLPSWVSQLSTRSESIHGLSGDFLQGVFATLLATPCSAPFLGTAIGFALTQTWIEISIVFIALGFGMALPYLLIAIFPKLVMQLPRPGPWMTVIKRFLGVALIASWVWLLSILANNIGLVGSIAVGGLTVLAAWLLLLGQRAFLVITATIVLAFLVPRLVGELSNKVTENNILSNSQYSNTDELNKLWKTFNEAAIPILVAQGKTVFVDVTANWCLTCQVNKRLVLDSKAILEILKSQNVIAMRADWTKPDRNISTYLSQYGRYGIPFNAIYGPDSPSGIVLPELLNKNKVLDAFFQASKTSKMPNEGITK